MKKMLLSLLAVLCMTGTAGKMMDAMLRKKDAYEAQNEVITILDRLEKSGEIVIARPGEEEDFV